MTKKTTSKKTTNKKSTAPKKAVSTKKATTKKTAAKKTVAKKATVTKTAPKKTVAKKTTTKAAANKATTIKKPVAAKQDFSKMKVGELKEFLASKKIEIPAGSKKADLVKLAEGGKTTKAKKVTISKEAEAKYKKVTSSLNSSLKKSKKKIFTTEEVFNLLEKGNMIVEEEEAEEFLAILASKKIISKDSVRAEDLKSDGDEDLKEIIKTPEEIEQDRLENLRNLSDKEINSELSAAQDHIK